MELLKLAEKHSSAQLEQACAKALSYSGKPIYESIKNILVILKDKPDLMSDKTETSIQQ